MDTREVQQHVTVLGWLYIIGHAIFLAIGGFVFILLVGIGVASGEPAARSILGVVGMSVGGLLAVLSVPGLAAGYGLLTHKPWARVLALVVGILGLVNVPVGTAIGLYAVWVLTQPAATVVFAEPTPA